MDTHSFLGFCFFLLYLLSGRQQAVEGVADHHHHRLNRHKYSTSGSVLAFKPNKLFVFGDSYADTGNNRKSLASSWKIPYGITFPGKPAGRFSDGRVLTDYLAHYLKIRTPIPYRWRKPLASQLKYGMNFAYGGTGVFNTLVPEPNMTTQIDFVQQLLNESVYTKRQLKSSVALVSVAGNDYSTYIARNGSAEGFESYIVGVVNQLAVNLKRIHNMGVRKVAVNALQPLGCLPQSTVKFSFQQCNGTENVLVGIHNKYLQQAVNRLNAETNSTSFVILDLYTAFWTVFNHKQVHQGCPTFENPYQPCCVGLSAQYSCGSVDQSGAKKYTLCTDPKSKFFWDTVHPTQQGWHAVYSTPAMQNSLIQL